MNFDLKNLFDDEQKIKVPTSPKHHLRMWDVLVSH